MRPSVKKLLLFGTTAPYAGAMLALDFVGSRSAGTPYYMFNGVRYPTVTAVPGWTYTGGTPAGTGSYAPKADGSLQFFPSVTNLLLQSQTFDNASWGKSDTTVTADAATAPDGTTTADLLTDGSAGSAQINQAVTVSAGQTLAVSRYFKRGNTDWVLIKVDSTGGANGFGQWFNLNTGATGSQYIFGTGTFVSAQIVASANGFYRASVIGRVDSAATTAAVRTFNTSANNSETRVSGGTRYEWGAQLELGSTASTYIPTTTAAVTVAPPRITDAGYLAEEARTNSIRNSTATNGAVVGVIGSGGALPTNWGHAGGSTAGLTATVVATGTDAGLPYIDVRYSGTTSSTSFSPIFESTTAIAASAAQVWTSSQYIKLVSGSLTNITSIYSQVDGIGGSAGSGLGSVVVPSSSLARMTATYTLGTGATNVRMSMTVAVNNGAAVDVTLRIYQPQLELGSFATSPIPTTSVAVTRAADVMQITNAGPNLGYTLITNVNSPILTGNRAILTLGSNRGQIYATGGNYATAIADAATLSSQAQTAGFANLAATFASSAQSLVINGALVGNTTNATSDGASRTVIIGAATNLLQHFNAQIRRIVIYPRAMSNSELQAVTLPTAT